MKFNRVIVLGLGIDGQVKKALSPFSPVYLDVDVMQSLYLISKANRIIMANSTFSWWGAFLSEAQEIYYPRPVRGIWSPTCPEIALEVPESRYQIIDQVAVQNWRPFKLVAPINSNLLKNKEGESILNIRVGQKKGSMNVPSKMSDMVERIIEFDRPFGLLDFADLELSARSKVNLVELLFALNKAGAIESESGTFKALKGAVQGLRAF